MYRGLPDSISLSYFELTLSLEMKKKSRVYKFMGRPLLLYPSTALSRPIEKSFKKKVQQKINFFSDLMFNKVKQKSF